MRGNQRFSPAEEEALSVDTASCSATEAVAVSVECLLALGVGGGNVSPLLPSSSLCELRCGPVWLSSVFSSAPSRFGRLAKTVGDPWLSSCSSSKGCELIFARGFPWQPAAAVLWGLTNRLGSTLQKPGGKEGEVFPSSPCFPPSFSRCRKSIRRIMVSYTSP